MICVVQALLALALTAGGPSYRRSFPLPTETVPSGWGVNIHFTDPAPGEMEKLAAGGFKWVRMDFSWAGIERARGQYDFAPYDRLMRSLKAAEIRPVFILCYGNDLYEHGSPTTAESRSAFCKFVNAGIRHFQGQGILWEMWNEPNISFWQPKPDVNQYIALAKAVGETIRRTAPEEWFIGPATSGFDWAFLQKCFDAGLLKYWDAVSVHPYRGGPPETAAADWTRLRAMIDARAPRGKTIPMFSGEWGYADQQGGIPAEQQAAYAVRQYLSNLMCGAPLSILYDWKNDGTGPTDPECHFGAMTIDLQPKPSYVEIQRVSHALAGYTYKMRLAQDSDQDYALAFQKGRSVKYAAWTISAAPRDVNLRLGADSRPLTLTDTPQILESHEPSLVLSQQPLPETFYVRDLQGTRSFVSRVIEASVTPVLSLRGVRASVGIIGGDGSFFGAVASPNWAKAGEMLARRIAGDWSAAPQSLRIDLRLPSRQRLTREVTCIQTRPVWVHLVVAGGRPRALIDNPSKHAFEFHAQWEGQPECKPVSLGPGDPPSRLVSIAPPGGVEGGSSVRIGLSAAGFDDAQSDIEPVAFGRFAEPQSEVLAGARYGISQDGDPKIMGTISAQPVRADGGPLAGAEAVRIDYSFPPGWKFLELKPHGPLAQPVRGKPSELNMFVKGNGSSDGLRMRFVDATGQCFQPEYGPLDWTGWRFVSIKLDSTYLPHWGGINDGVIHYPVHMETLVLVNPGRDGTPARSITVAGITLVNRE